jgi:hypothetical protein
VAVRKFLLISIDCLRYDALSRTNPRLETPKFDVLTDDYQLADRFFVTAPATRPSHTSLFTGLYPFEHGLYGQTYLKMFDGVTNLMHLLQRHGFEVSGHSERPDVFRFLDYEACIGPLDPGARNQCLGSMEPVLDVLDQGADAPQLRFLHFWYTHGGYGLSGIELNPGLKALVEAGQAEEALRFYYAAAVQVQEYRIVEILKKIDLSEWAVFLFGDHGEGFDPEIMSHGDHIHQNVVRVPLLAHLPDSDWRLPEDTLSMIDLFPTICDLAEVDADYHGYGQSLITGTPRPDRWVLTELDSLYGVGFLNPGNLEVEHRRVTSRLAIDEKTLERNPQGTRQWSISDGNVLFRYDEINRQHVLRDVVSGKDLECGDPAPFHQRYQRLLDGSAYADLRAQDESDDEKTVLEQRLKDLGYL